jgi:hypothetical protein
MHGGDPTQAISDLKYLRIIAFLLVENDLIQPEELLSESNLASVVLR